MSLKQMGIKPFLNEFFFLHYASHTLTPTPLCQGHGGHEPRWCINIEAVQESMLSMKNLTQWDKRCFNYAAIIIKNVLLFLLWKDNPRSSEGDDGRGERFSHRSPQCHFRKRLTSWEQKAKNPLSIHSKIPGATFLICTDTSLCGYVCDCASERGRVEACLCTVWPACSSLCWRQLLHCVGTGRVSTYLKKSDGAEKVGETFCVTLGFP